MSGISFVGVGVGLVNSGAASGTVVVPSAALPGDVMFAWVNYGGGTPCLSASNITGGAGGTWAQVAGFPTGAAGSGVGQDLWWRAAATGDPGATLTVNFALSNQKAVLYCAVYRGASTISPVDSGSTAKFTNTASTSISSNATTTTQLTWVMTCACSRDSAVTTTYSALQDTQRSQDSNTGSSEMAAVIEDTNGDVAAGTYTKTITQSQSLAYCIGVIGIAPAPAGGAGVIPLPPVAFPPLSQAFGPNPPFWVPPPQPPPAAAVAVATLPPLVAEAAATPGFGQPGPAVISRNSLADAPVLTTPAPVVVEAAATPGFGWPNAGLLARSSLQDFATPVTPVPQVIEAAATPGWGLPNAALTSRSSLADAPVLTTPSPVIRQAAATPGWGIPGPAVISSAPPIAAAAPAQAAPPPVVVWQQPLAVPPQQALTSRSSLADAPVLTTPAPLVVMATAVTPWGRPQAAVITANPGAPPAVAAVTPAPVVVAQAVKLAAAQPPVILRNTLADPLPLTTPSPIVVAAPVRWPPTFPVISGAPPAGPISTPGVLTAASAPGATLTATAAAQGTLTGQAAASALTASTAAQGSLITGTQKTGGPS